MAAARVLRWSPAAAFVVRKVILSRHGSTKWNSKSDPSKEKVRGWVDLPLNDMGRMESQKTAEQLKKVPGVGFIISSDLKRSVETAMMFHKTTGLPYLGPTPAFRPWNLGKFQGMESVKAAPYITEYAQNKPHIPVPQGEAFHDFERRFFTGLRHLLTSHQELPCIVTHYRCFCMVEAWQLAGSRPDGSIDHVSFCKKNNHPAGHLKEYDVDVERLPQ